MMVEKSIAGALILIKMDGILTAPSYEFGHRCTYCRGNFLIECSCCKFIIHILNAVLYCIKSFHPILFIP